MFEGADLSLVDVDFVNLIWMKVFFGIAQVDLLADKYFKQVWVDVALFSHAGEYFQGLR